MVGAGYILHHILQFVYLYLFRSLARNAKQEILVKAVQVPPLHVSFAPLLSLVPTASHCCINTCPPKADGTSPAHLTSDVLMTLREQQLSISTPQPLSPVREQLVTKDTISCVEKLFTDELQGGWRISQWPPCIGWVGALVHCSVARETIELFSVL